MKHFFVTIALVLFADANLLAAEPKVVIEDAFNAKPAQGWTWLRENPKAWRMADGALEIRVEPGRAPDVKNALVRSAPDRSQGTFAAEVTITSLSAPTNQYEQAGITWYVGGKPLVKIVKELVNGQVCMILGGPKAAPGKSGGPRRTPMSDQTVQLRLIVSADDFTGQFRPGAKGAFQTLGSGALPPPLKDQVSIQCYNGSADAEHWFRFDDFRILKID